MRVILICLTGVFLTLPLEAKDNFHITFALAGTQEAKRVDDVDQDKFQENRPGFGVFIESERLKNRFSFESGVYKVIRQHTIVENSFTIAEGVEKIHLPLLARYYPWTFISIGIGPYGAFSVSNTERAIEKNAQEGASTSAEAAEYGSQTSIAINIPLKDQKAGALLVVDFRWLEPFERKRGEETNNLSGFIGLKLEI